MTSAFHFAFFLCLTSGLLISGNRSSEIIDTPSACCPSGWSQHGSRCFIVQTSSKTMDAAELTCIDLGGNLASIHNQEEHNFVRSLVFQSINSHPRTWIGLFDAIKEGRWMWTDGTRADFLPWAPGQPDNGSGTEHCGHINFRGKPQWNDDQCHNKKPFVCARRK